MKKLALLAVPLLLLSACQKSETIKIICPTGAPAFAFYKEATNANFETNSVPKNIVAMMNASSDKNVVVIDTTSGIQAISKGAPYKLAATITFGNFFIASTGKDDNNTMDPGDKIILFNQGATPDLLFHYLYGNTYDAGIEYVTAVSDAATCLISGKNQVTGSEIKYVFIAQPVLLNALAKNTNAAKYVDIQEAYKTKSGGKSLIQASAFIKNSAQKSSIKKYLNTLEEDVNKAVENPDLIAEAISALPDEEASAKYGVPATLAVKALKDNNGLGLGMKSAYTIKEDIDSFLKNVQNLEATSEEIYYK